MDWYDLRENQFSKKLKERIVEIMVNE